MMSILADLTDKELDVEGVAGTVWENEETLSELLEGVQSRQDTIRYSSFKVLMLLSEEHPELLYPNKWDFFVELLILAEKHSDLLAKPIPVIGFVSEY